MCIFCVDVHILYITYIYKVRIAYLRNSKLNQFIPTGIEKLFFAQFCLCLQLKENTVFPNINESVQDRDKLIKM